MADKKLSARRMDILNGPMMKNILWFALPLALGGIIQQLFTSADMAVVYWFDDAATTAQAAVSSNGALVNLLINLFVGLSVGSTVLIAEKIGKNQTDDIHSIVFTALTVSLICGIALTGLGIGVSAPILKLMGTPAEVFPLAVQYLRIYFVGMPFLMVYNFGAAILRSIGDTKKSLIVLFVSGVVNVGLNILFVAVFDMSVAGVAIATIAANIMCAALVVVYILKEPMLKFSFKRSKVRAEYVKRMFVVGMPAGLQGMVFSLANIFIQSSINSFGDAAMAGSGNAVNFEVYVYYFINGFSQATVTFVGQNYAAGKYDRCRRVFRLNMLSALIVSGTLSLIFIAGGRLFIRIYTSDPQAIEYAMIRMWCVLSGTLITCTYEIPGGALRGIGHSLLPAVLTVVGSCVLRIVWIYSIFIYYPYYWLLLIIYPISWTLTGIAVMLSYFIIGAREYKTPKEVGRTDDATELDPTFAVAAATDGDACLSDNTEKTVGAETAADDR